METEIEINDDLITQWEPKVQKLASSVFVLDMDRDDIAQELRIAILKAAKGFDSSLGTSFHTYLHTTMMNTLRTLIVKAQRKHLEVQSIDDLLDTTYDEAPSNKVQQALGIADDSFEELEVLRLEGLTMEEITEDLHESAYSIRLTLREKVQALFEGEEFYDYGKTGESNRRL